MAPQVVHGGTESMSMMQRLRHFTPRTLYLSLAPLNFGYDVGSFSGVQAMPAYRRRFGSYDPK